MLNPYTQLADRLRQPEDQLSAGFRGWLLAVTLPDHSTETEHVHHGQLIETRREWVPAMALNVDVCTLILHFCTTQELLVRNQHKYRLQLLPDDVATLTGQRMWHLARSRHKRALGTCASQHCNQGRVCCGAGQNVGRRYTSIWRWCRLRKLPRKLPATTTERIGTTADFVARLHARYILISVRQRFELSELPMSGL